MSRGSRIFHDFFVRNGSLEEALADPNTPPAEFLEKLEQLERPYRFSQQRRQALFSAALNNPMLPLWHLSDPVGFGEVEMAFVHAMDNWINIAATEEGDATAPNRIRSICPEFLRPCVDAALLSVSQERCRKSLLHSRKGVQQLLLIAAIFPSLASLVDEEPGRRRAMRAAEEIAKLCRAVARAEPRGGQAMLDAVKRNEKWIRNSVTEQMYRGYPYDRSTNFVHLAWSVICSLTTNSALLGGWWDSYVDAGRIYKELADSQIRSLEKKDGVSIRSVSARTFNDLANQMIKIVSRTS